MPMTRDVVRDCLFEALESGPDRWNDNTSVGRPGEHWVTIDDQIGVEDTVRAFLHRLTEAGYMVVPIDCSLAGFRARMGYDPNPYASQKD